MAEERVARSVSSALMVLLVAFVPLYALLGFAFATSAFCFGLGCAALGTAVALLLGRKNAALQMLCAALPAAALALLVPVAIPCSRLARVCLAGSGALLSLWAERLALRAGSPGRASGRLLAPLGVLLAVCAALWFTVRQLGGAAPGLWAMMLAVGAVWLAAALLLLNRLSLREAAYSAGQGGVPAGVRRGGLAGAAAFAAAVFLLAGMGFLTQAFGQALRQLAAWLLQAFLFLASLFPAGQQAQPSSTASPQSMLPPVQGQASPLLQLLSSILIAAVLLAVAVGVVWGLRKLLPRLWRALAGRVTSLVGTWRADEGYEDRAESLMTLRQALSDAGAGLLKAARRLRRRPRLSDYPTNSGKARYLFREYLRELALARRSPPPGATPLEIARSAPALSAAYNLARYAEEEPGDGEIERARQAVRSS